MSGRGRGGAAAAVLLVLALAPGCSPATLPPPPPAPVHDAWPGCAGVGAFDDRDGSTVAPSEGAVPDGFAPVSVVLCEDRSTDTVRTGLERTSTEVAPLVAYLARPSEAPGDGPCTADGWVRPWLFLVDGSGRHVAPTIPVDACSKPLGWDAERDPPAWATLPYTDRVVR